MDLELTLGVAKGLVGLVVWAAAAWLYLDYRRNGEKGFKRFAAFWVGFPATLGCLCMIPEGTAEREEERSVHQEEIILLNEIRSEREDEGTSRDPSSPDRPFPAR